MLALLVAASEIAAVSAVLFQQFVAVAYTNPGPRRSVYCHGSGPTVVALLAVALPRLLGLPSVVALVIRLFGILPWCNDRAPLWCIRHPC